MRHSMRTLLFTFGVVLLPTLSSAAEDGSAWWKFPRPKAAEETAVVDTPVTGMPTTPLGAEQSPITSDVESEVPEQNWMIKSPFGKVSWPRFSMPKSKESTADAATVNPNRNSWAAAEVEPTKPSMFERFNQSTRQNWERTKAAFKPKESEPAPSSRIAQAKEPSMWDRMFGKKEAEKNQGSQTIGEFIAQERVDP